MAAFLPSNSYGDRVQSPGAMKRSLRLSRHARGLDARSHSGRPVSSSAPRVASALPQPGPVIAEIGAILAVHLALAIVVALAVRALGIA